MKWKWSRPVVSGSLRPWGLCSPPGSSTHGILQARILEWVAISFSRGSSWPRNRTQVSHKQADALTSEPPGKPCVTLCDTGLPWTLIPWTLYSPWNSPGQNTGVTSLSLLQGSNPGLPHCRWILYQLSHKESPRILEWVAFPFSSGSSQPRNRTRVSCIAGEFFTNWAIRIAREAPILTTP